MPYIGRSTDGFGVRNRFIYLASSGDTSVSGADANGATLTFTDGAYVDVYLNGVLLKPTTDYNTSTAGTIAGLSALNTNDEVTVVVYDVFTVADMVSATSGGTFSGAVTLSGGITGDTSIGDNDKLTFGAGNDLQIYHTPGTGSFIDEADDGSLFIRSSRVTIHKYTGETMINAVADGAVSLYYDDAKMLETSTRGIMVGGGTAQTFNTGMSSLQVGRGAIQQWNASHGATYVTSNVFYNTSGNWEYIDGGSANVLSLNNGSLYYYHAENGSDGGTASLVERVRIYHNNGNNDNYNYFIANRNSLSNYVINKHSSEPYGLYIWFDSAAPDNNSQYFLRCIDTSATRMTVFSDGDVATADAGTLSSDIKLKNTITDATDKWDDVKKLKVRNFYWNEDYHPKKKDKKMIGFIAQEFETVFPGLVSELKDEIAVNEKDENGNDTTVHKDLGTTTKHIKEGKLIPILTKALQEAMTRIETLEAKVKALEEA